MIFRPVTIVGDPNTPHGHADSMVTDMLREVLGRLFSWCRIIRRYDTVSTTHGAGLTMDSMPEGPRLIAGQDEELLSGGFTLAVNASPEGEDESMYVLRITFILSDIGRGFLPKAMTITVGDAEPRTFTWTASEQSGHRVIASIASDRPQIPKDELLSSPA